MSIAAGLDALHIQGVLSVVVAVTAWCAAIGIAARLFVR
jgi:hypothetical protein